MKKGSLIPLIERAVHDTWSSVQKVPVMLRDPAAVSADHVTLVEPGQCEVMLEDESVFHGVELPPSVTRWGGATWHTLRDAFVVGDQGHVFRSTGEFVSLCPSLRRLDPAKIRHPMPLLAPRLKGEVFHLTGRDHENHGHYVMQYLPRLMAALPHLRARGIHPRVLAAHGHERWQGRYLGALGFDAEHVLPCRKGTLSIEELHYVPMLWDEGPLGPPHLYQQVQEALRRYANVDESAPLNGKPIFVTREDAPTRRLTNEREIIEICRRHLGEIEVMFLPKVPFVEQIRRFAASPLIIGPQGQGITNIGFSRGARMLILEAGQSPFDRGWACDYRDFAHMTGNSALRMFSGLPWPNDGDWPFPPEEFEKQLKRVLALGLQHHREPVVKVSAR